MIIGRVHINCHICVGRGRGHWTIIWTGTQSFIKASHFLLWVLNRLVQNIHLQTFPRNYSIIFHGSMFVVPSSKMVINLHLTNEATFLSRTISVQRLARSIFLQTNNLTTLYNRIYIWDILTLSPYPPLFWNKLKIFGWWVVFHLFI